jgi:response regulator RpfG family c-di-GMP phosphodiesterase
MKEKILFVDDDVNLLAGCERSFRRQFRVETAEGAEVALKKIAESGPYAVVISDRQMPNMDGIQFLSLVRERAPDTVRIMLTGNADLEGAIKVVNEGNIFRFLTKPCAHDVLAVAVADALAQYRLIVAEKELLNKTLGGSIKLLTDILGMLDPKSFGRMQAVRNLISHVGQSFKFENDWEIPLAFMLAPIGNVTVPTELLNRSRMGGRLSVAEQQAIAQLPETATRLIDNIPRMEGVARIIRYHRKNYDGSGCPVDTVKGDELPLGARLIRIIDDLAALESRQVSRAAALDDMQARLGFYDPVLLNAVREFYGVVRSARNPAAASMAIALCDLAAGMVLSADIETEEGIIIFPAGHHLTEMTLEKIKNFSLVSQIKEPLLVESPELG